MEFFICSTVKVDTIASTDSTMCVQLYYFYYNITENDSLKYVL